MPNSFEDRRTDPVVVGLLDLSGVGPVVALLAVWFHGRIPSEAAFAGIAPLSASPSRTTRHQSNRGGDSTFNAALHKRHCRRGVNLPDNECRTPSKIEGRIWSSGRPDPSFDHGPAPR
ncbi:hypothetical protein [Dactylosporangium sp. NPDC006015]|uniref:hypothetical protein n=1 Tax=Dactylosporangium sp. NPDC006015 TaxID=3154576 RepID=UPI0033A02E03